MSTARICIVIPAFNEAKRIVTTVQTLIAQGYADIIVVDDGSTDATGAVIAPFAKVLRHRVNRGMGAALATGTQYALRHGADIIVHFDADGQHRAEDIAALIVPLQDDRADIVFGSRYMGLSEVPWTKRYLLHAPARWFQNRMTGIRLTDVHNGFRAMNRRAASQIRIRQDRMAHASEIVSEVKRNGLRYTEVPVTILYHEYGQGLVGGLRIVKDLLIRKFL